MRDINRIDRILELIGNIWKKSPDQRFGQMLINNFIINDDLRTWQNEDNGFEKYLKEIIKSK